MDSTDILIDAVERIRSLVHDVTEEITAEELTFRPDPEANTVAWLVWHLTRVQDSQVAQAAGTNELWITESWEQQFVLPFDRSASGYGQTPDEVAEVHPPVGLLVGYHDEVADRTVAYLRELDASDLDRVVDAGWDPPVTLGIRLISILSDDLQHAGQAAYIRGLAERSRGR
jgi:hypothetical protein